MKNFQRGFSIITAIFLLVVLAFLGVAMVTFSTSQHQSSAMDVMGSRAYQAARAGVEWAAYGVVNASSVAGVPWPECATGKTFLQNDLGGTLAPFTVAVTCASSSVTGDSINYVYSVSASAVTGGSPGSSGYIERVISVKMGH